MKPYYERDGITIFHGDCLEILRCSRCNDTGIEADRIGLGYEVKCGACHTSNLGAPLILTDPPYGISHASNHTAPTTTAKWMNSTIQGDESVAARDAVLAKATEWVCFGSPDIAPPPNADDVLIWDKGPASGMGDLAWPWKRSWELVFVRGSRWSGRRDEGVLKNFHVVTRASMGRVHPNEKPVSLMRHFIAKHDAEIILDPFMGSGTTLVAAKLEGRKAIGIEIEERYCEIAAKRLAQGVLAFP